MMIPEQKYRYLARLFSKYGEMKEKITSVVIV